MPNMTTKLPLIRLSAINPLLLELRRRGVDTGPLLHEHGLPTGIPVTDDLFVASDTVYEIVEQCGDLSGDEFFGFAVGSSLNLQNWPPIASAMERATTVGELLTMFSIHAGEHSTATRFFVSTEGERSTFGFERVKEPAFTPGQNDAFYMGFMLPLLRHSTRDQWDAASVLFTIAEPHCVPANNEAYRIAKGDRSGVRISFPSQWLFERFEKSNFKSRMSEAVSADMPRSLITSLRTALRPHIHECDLTADKAAKICGHDRRWLSRELRERGTTLSTEITALRADKASRELVETDHPVARIAESVGFTDPTVFSRAFKNWTGQSPRDYRRTHKSPG
jgi:AraC-like DNA-binding protein